MHCDPAHGQTVSWPDPLPIQSLSVQESLHGTAQRRHKLYFIPAITSRPGHYLKARSVQITAVPGGGRNLPGLLGVSVWGRGTTSQTCSSAEAQAENTVAWGYERSHKKQNGKT